MGIGSRIRALRKGAGMSQQDLAERLHVTRQAVSGWENGRTAPDLETMRAMAALFGTGLAALLGEAAADRGEGPEHPGAGEARTPAGHGRGRYLLLLALAAGIAAALVLCATLLPWLRREAAVRFQMTPYMLCSYMIPPAGWACAAGLALALLDLWRDLRVKRRGVRRLLLAAAAGLAALWLGALPAAVWGGPAWFTLLLFFLNAPQWAALPASCLFFALNGGEQTGTGAV